MTDIDYSWQDHSNCKNIDPDLFFPTRGEKMDQEVLDACHSCPVREQCIEHALKHERFGYWGGTSERQRNALRKLRGIKLESPQIGALNELHHLAQLGTRRKSA